MIPGSYAVPAAIVLVLSGAVSCFFGHRVFRIVLGINGFLIGAWVTTTAMGQHGAFAMAVGAIVGGIVGAVLMIATYYVGVALAGAAVAALAISLVWKLFGGEPHWIAVVVAAIAGALIALSVTRYVIIIATAFGGAWTLLFGAMALAGGRTLTPTGTWVIYPLDPAPGRWWVLIVWLAIGLAGLATQLKTKSAKKT